MIKRELMIFLIVGLLTVLIDFISYRGLIWLHWLNVDLAKGAGFIIGTCFAYFANRLWTFGHKNHAPGSMWRFVLLYAMTLSVNVCVNFLALYIFNQFSQVVLIAFLLATGISAMLNFFGMKWFVFKHHATMEVL